MVVCYWRIAYSVGTDGAGGSARSARWGLSRQWCQRVRFLWHYDFRRRIVGRLFGISHESTQVNTESEKRRIDALFAM